MDTKETVIGYGRNICCRLIIVLCNHASSTLGIVRLLFQQLDLVIHRGMLRWLLSTLSQAVILLNCNPEALGSILDNNIVVVLNFFRQMLL
jgi:hypothetical protein